MNQYNHGQLAGIIAKAPDVKELRNGAKSIRLTIRTYPDPNDGPEREAARRAEQNVVVGIYVPAGRDASKYENAKQGMTATCDFWVESYTYQRDGVERSGQSLATKDVTLAWPDKSEDDGVTGDDDGWDGYGEDEPAF